MSELIIPTLIPSSCQLSNGLIISLFTHYTMPTTPPPIDLMWVIVSVELCHRNKQITILNQTHRNNLCISHISKNLRGGTSLTLYNKDTKLCNVSQAFIKLFLFILLTMCQTFCLYCGVIAVCWLRA
jgi:hypothetical protein